ncbi:MAG: hypothetical protein QF926_11730 [Alphaproteobacteria bacterium]|jgi:hypothetical protein|nr:hypothetical protein [Alphaproteobacteria bacterium]
MDSRSVVFLEIMIGIAVVGLAAFAGFLLSRYLSRRGDGATAEAKAAASPWYAFVPALALLIVIAALLIWQLAPPVSLEAGDGGWREQPRAFLFMLVMLAAGAIGLVAFLALLVSRRGDWAGGRTSVPAPAAASEATTVETPAAARLLAPLLLGLAFLVLCWVYVPREVQYTMMSQLIYPASLAVALVLLFDKAMRAWSVKGPGANLREWMFCDAITFLLILGYLNLLGVRAGEAYAALVCDFVAIILFFLTFWILDRKLTRYRFLVAHGYLILLPILWLIWRVVQAVPEPEVVSWWSTFWPFLILAVVFFFLEIIALLGARETDRHLVPAVKDGVFLALYAILLLVAMPEASG